MRIAGAIIGAIGGAWLGVQIGGFVYSLALRLIGLYAAVPLLAGYAFFSWLQRKRAATGDPESFWLGLARGVQNGVAGGAAFAIFGELLGDVFGIYGVVAGLIIGAAGILYSHGLGMGEKARAEANRINFQEVRTLITSIHSNLRTYLYDGALKFENPYAVLEAWENGPLEQIDRLRDKTLPNAAEAERLRSSLKPLLAFYKGELVEKYPNWPSATRKEMKAEADQVDALLAKIQYGR